MKTPTVHSSPLIFQRQHCSLQTFVRYSGSSLTAPLRIDILHLPLTITINTKTMNKKINLDIIHTLIYISENEVGNQPGNWVLGQWDSWGRKRSHVARKKHMKTSRLSFKAIIVFGVSQRVNLPAHNLSLLICTSYLTSYS